MYVPGKGPGLHPSGARGPRLKSLDLPLRVCIYIRTYILTVARTCSCAEPVWPLSDPVLSCFFFTPHASKPFSPPVLPVQYILPCPALHCNAPHIPTALHYIALCCTVARLHSPCVLPCTITLPPTRASSSVANTPTARKRYRVHRARSSSALCHGYLINHRVLTQPGGVRASNPYLLVRDMNEDHPHTTR